MCTMTDLLLQEAARDAAGRHFARLDRTRRMLGRLVDAMGLGPVQSASRVVMATPALVLKAFGEPRRTGPILLIIPAPIKQAYIWDLAPSISAVRRCVEGGIQTYMIEWQRPGDQDQGRGLGDYAQRLTLACLAAIEKETGQSRVLLAGHSLGGTLAAIFAALYAERVQGLILIEAPIAFGPKAGAFGPLVASAPRAGGVTARLGNVPGSFLNLASILASPVEFGWSRWLDLLASSTDAHRLQTHVRVERWTLDEMPMPRQLYEEVLDWLYREDCFMRGILKIGARQISPQRVTCPVLTVADRKSVVVPPQSVVPFHEASGAQDKRLLWYGGDTGVSLQHVGALVGQTAHRILWPQIGKWMHGHWTSR